MLPTLWRHKKGEIMEHRWLPGLSAPQKCISISIVTVNLKNVPLQKCYPKRSITEKRKLKVTCPLKMHSNLKIEQVFLVSCD
jgi:hypothetical protein